MASSNYAHENFIQEYIELYNCTTSFTMYDRDNNTYIDLYEFIYLINTFELIPDGKLTDAQFQQINCSSCFGDT